MSRADYGGILPKVASMLYYGKRQESKNLKIDKWALQ
jgi:hypothetical protein